MTKYTVDELVVEYSKLDPTDWGAISTTDFLEYLKAKEEEEKKAYPKEDQYKEEVLDLGSPADQEVAYL